jgi:lipoyl synthase
MRSHRIPSWLRTRLPAASRLAEVRGKTYRQGLHTVCREARCPNQGECSERGEAAFLILGDICTRNCAFCGVKHGTPRAVDPEEPRSVAAAVDSLNLKHAVVTSVTRDDLPDGGASAFAATIRAIRAVSPATTVEVLIPDFQGSQKSLAVVVEAEPDVLNHNVETVPRIYPSVRQGASYSRSIELFGRTTELNTQLLTKSGLMVGLGETFDEMAQVVRDLVAAGCKALTVGQYLRPALGNHPVQRFVPPEEFESIKNMASSNGMIEVAAGPLVRSSYKAAKIFERLQAIRLRE